MRRLTCLSPNGSPARGDAEFIFTREGQEVERIVLELDDEGSVEIPAYGNLAPDAAMVVPSDRHWSALIPIGKGNVRKQLVPFEMPQHCRWWRELIGRRSFRQSAGAGIRIGVVDLGFKSVGSLGHIQKYDIEGHELKPGFGPGSSHGLRVCKIIGERGPSLERQGIAPAASLTLVDVADDDEPSKIDSDRVAPAIELLADVGVDLINLSSGSYAPANDKSVREVLLKSVRYARSRGALTIAAAGNRGEAPAMPARFDEVVGVGSVGLIGVAPKGTLMATYGEIAAITEGCVGASALGTVFHDIDSCYGKGLNAVGPGIGVTLCYDDGSIIDYRGTSYAAPAVTSALACRLASTSGYADLTGADRADFAQGCLQDMCQDTGLPELRQGSGLPMLPSSN